MYKYYFLLFLSTILLGCKEKQIDNKTYFSGQVINPKGGGIHLYLGEKSIGFSNLNAKNQFNIVTDNLEEGLYKFSHGDEFQYVYLEPKDSLVMRLNSWDFDESLIFSGKGGERNNFLIHLFLENEKEDKLFSKYFNLSETEFLQKTDSLLKRKLVQYAHFKKGTTKQSILFNELIDITIKHPYFAKKEAYSFIDIQKGNRTTIKPVNNQFYAHRSDASHTSKKYANYYAHRMYLINRVLNEAYTEKSKFPKENLSVLLLNQINKTIKDTVLKNDMLYKSITRCMLDKTCSVNDKNSALQVFYKNCCSEKNTKKIIALESSFKILTKNSKLPKIPLTNYTNGKLDLIDAVKNNTTVVYFWPKEKKRIKNLIKRVKYLETKYPNHLFIGVDNQQNKKHWKKIIDKFNLNSLNQYQLVNSTKNKWFVNEIPRTIIVNKKGLILNDFTYLTHSDFEKLLK